MIGNKIFSDEDNIKTNSDLLDLVCREFCDDNSGAVIEYYDRDSDNDSKHTLLAFIDSEKIRNEQIEAGFKENGCIAIV